MSSEIEQAMQERREPIILQMTCAAASAGELVYDFLRACTIEKVTLRFYQGQQRNLRITPWIETPAGVRERLFKVDAAGLADDYIAGNDDTWELNIVRPIVASSSLVLAWANIHAAEAYTLYCLIEIDYRGGLSSWGGAR